VANVRGAKKRSREFWQGAVDRIKSGEQAGSVAEELGVDLRGLYRWRQRLDPVSQEPRREREAGLVKEVERLKRALAEKVLEVDFFKGALRKIEARRRRDESGGAQVSTTRSGK
jgi:hypothetical protein